MDKIYQYPLKIDKEIIEHLRVHAKEQGRSLNKQIEFILREYLQNIDFQNNQKNNQS